MKLTLTSLALLTIFISWLFSVQPLCSLCLCGCFFEQFLTKEAQRTQRLHREEVRKRLFGQSPFSRHSPANMTSSTATPWFTSKRPNARARLRLFCFPYAGGGPAIYRLWPQNLPTDVEICVAQLPGRGTRMREQPFTNLDALVQAATEAIKPLLDKPFALFGHSMGAMISFELARRLREQGQPQPSYLFISGRRAPQLPNDDPLSYNLPDTELRQELLRLNGTPKEVLEHPELMELMLPLLRADFSVVETYEYRPGVPL